MVTKKSAKAKNRRKAPSKPKTRRKAQPKGKERQRRRKVAKPSKQEVVSQSTPQAPPWSLQFTFTDGEFVMSTTVVPTTPPVPPTPPIDALNAAQWAAIRANARGMAALGRVFIAQKKELEELKKDREKHKEATEAIANKLRTADPDAKATADAIKEMNDVIAELEGMK